MTENVEISNPMYLRGEDMDETEDPPETSGDAKVKLSNLNWFLLPFPLIEQILTIFIFQNSNNFANPVYESLYSGGEEKKTLLSELHGEPLPLDNECV